MSVGIIDTRTNPSQLNAVEFLWDPAKRTSAFIQVWIFTLLDTFGKPWVRWNSQCMIFSLNAYL